MQRSDEDWVAFNQDGPAGPIEKVLRGKIVSEDETFVHVERRDGRWSIRKSIILKIHRARRPLEEEP